MRLRYVDLGLLLIIFASFSGVIPGPIHLADDLFLFFFPFLLLAETGGRLKLPRFFALLALCLGLWFVSTFANDSGWGRAFYSMRLYLLPPFLFVLMNQARAREADLGRTFAVIRLIVLAQAGMVYLQGLRQIATAGMIHSVDSNYGFAGPNMANFLGYVVLIGLFDYGYRLAVGAPRFWRNAAFSFFLFFSLFIMGSRSAVFFGVLTFAFYFVWTRGRAGLRPMLKPALVFMAGLVIFLAAYGRIESQGFMKRYSPAQLVRDQLEPGGNTARLLHVPYAWEVLREHSVSPWVGVGPGTYESPAGHRFGSRLVDQKNRDIWWSNADPSKTSTKTTVTEIQLVTTMVEYGYLGVIFTAGLYVVLFLYVHRRRPPGRRFNRVSFVAGASVIALFLGNLNGNIWEWQFATYPVWGLAGMLTNPHIRRAADKKQNALA